MVADDDGISPAGHGESGVFHILYAFENQLAAPLLLDPLNVGPGKARVKLLVGPCRQGVHVAHFLDVSDQVAKTVAACAQHAQAPARLGQEVDDVGDGGPRRGGQAIFQILVALADHLQVKGEHQRAAPSHPGALDHGGHCIAVAHHVELKPERCRGVGRDVLYRADAHGGQGEGNAELFGRFGRKNLTVGMLHAGQAHRGNSDRHFHVDAHHFGGGAAVVHVDRHALAKLDFLKIGVIGAVGALGPRAGVGIVVKHAGYALLRQNAQVFDIGHHSHGGLLIGVPAW